MSRDVKSLVDELTEASMEAKRMLSELRSELKEARQVRREFEKAMTEMAAVKADEAFGAVIKDQLEGISTKINSVQYELSDRVMRRFDEVSNTAMYGNKQGRGPNIFDEMRRKAEELDDWLGKLQAAVDARRRILDDGS